MRNSSVVHLHKYYPNIQTSRISFSALLFVRYIFRLNKLKNRNSQVKTEQIVDHITKCIINYFCKNDRDMSIIISTL